MITGYKMCVINGENTLILYIDYNNEIGIDFNNFNKLSNMKEEIKKFIKNNHININGKKILLSFSGIILATLLVTSNVEEDFLDFTYVNSNILPNTEEIINTNDDKHTTNNINENANIIETNEVNSESVTTTFKSENITEKLKPDNNNVQESYFTSKDEEEIIQEKTSDNNETKQEIASEQMVTVYRNNGTTINISLEEYLIGVVGAEMPASFSIEALKAQAVVSRTYALKKLKNNERLTDTVATQSYKDNNELKNIWGNFYNTYYQKIKNAVHETKGLAIYYQNSLIDAVYHSTSNGKTENAEEVWQNQIPYLKSVDSTWDLDASSYLRTVSKDFINVLNLLNIDIANEANIEILSRNNSGRVNSIKVGDKILKGTEFRNLLGLRSTDFDLELIDNTLTITTRGYGHGVGMSQYGTNGMAKAGYNYEQILKHYYTGVDIY